MLLSHFLACDNTYSRSHKERIKQKVPSTFVLFQHIFRVQWLNTVKAGKFYMRQQGEGGGRRLAQEW